MASGLDEFSGPSHLQSPSHLHPQAPPAPPPDHRYYAPDVSHAHRRYAVHDNGFWAQTSSQSCCAWIRGLLNASRMSCPSLCAPSASSPSVSYLCNMVTSQSERRLWLKTPISLRRASLCHRPMGIALRRTVMLTKPRLSSMRGAEGGNWRFHPYTLEKGPSMCLYKIWMGWLSPAVPSSEKILGMMSWISIQPPGFRFLRSNQQRGPDMT